MKTKAEIEQLKANWLSDPCWDIEDTEGFEEHWQELRTWRLAIALDKQIAEDERLDKKANELKCSVELVKYIEFLEWRLTNHLQERGS